MFVYYDMIRRNYTNILIMEDDCNILYTDWKTYNSTYQVIRRDLPSDYSIVILGSLIIVSYVSYT